MARRSLRLLAWACAPAVFSAFSLSPGPHALIGSRAALSAVRRSPFQFASRSVITASADTEFDDYTAGTTFFFPGQGAQYVGMAKDVVEECPAAKDLFDKASAVLGYDLLDKCVNGPKEELDTTVISQPAIFVCSMAAVEKAKMEDDFPEADVCCGLSLGEYSALVFAGAISFEDGVKIVKARGEAMQAASEAADSSMASVVGLDSEKVDELCAAASEASGAKVQIANFLCPGNYAVSGATAAIEKVEEIAKPDFGAKMTVRLAVAGAFHTDFMAPAVPTLAEVLEGVEIQKPRIPVISNVDAKPHSDPAAIKQILTNQVTSPVQWETTVKTLMDKGYEQGYELGPGKVCAGILKRVSRRAKITNIAV